MGRFFFTCQQSLVKQLMSLYTKPLLVNHLGIQFCYRLLRQNFLYSKVVKTFCLHLAL